jgi:hypothetical protein
VLRVHLPPIDPFEDDHSLGDVRTDDLWHDDVFVVRKHSRNELGVVCLFDEVQLGEKVHFELVREGARLQQLRTLRTRLEQFRR